MLKNNLYIIFFYCVFISSNICQEIDFCVLSDGTRSGTCTHITKCSGGHFGPNDPLSYTKCSTGFLMICCPLGFDKTLTSTEAPTTTKASTTTFEESSIHFKTGTLTISAQKCEEYSSEAVVRGSIVPLATDIVEISSAKCSGRTDALVIGGQNAAVGEFPHMAILGYQRISGSRKIAWDCGGSLISELFVLTAAHCLYKSDHELKIVRLGELNYESDDDGANPKDYSIIEAIPHKNYDGITNYNDIALLRLNETVKFHTGLRPACLPTSSKINNELFATGWGWTIHAVASSASKILQKVSLEKFTSDECNAAYKIDSTGFPHGLQTSQFCVGNRDLMAEKDTCQGDSGGPVQYYHSNFKCMYTLYGITANGQGCGVPGVPGLYVQIFNYLDWIEPIVWEDN